MPRLFWKLFFTLWLSIMAFAVVVSAINQALIQRQEIEAPGPSFDVNLDRFESRLARDLREGGERRLMRSLRNLPRGMRDHIFVLDADGNELLGRDNMLKKLRDGRIKVVDKPLQSVDGRSYNLISAGRLPPRTLFAPGPRGVVMRLLAAAIISALVSLLLARYLAAPLGQLSRVSRQLASGDLSARLGAPLDQRKDEFGQLALDMDEMARRLQVSQQANRRLLRDVSHELRSPLARLRVALEIARNKDQSLVSEELNRIELESERLESLVDEVLSLLRESSGAQELSRNRFDLSDMLLDLVNTVNYEAADDGGKINLQQQTPLLLDADRELLWRVFENLLRNAMIHSGDVGDIQIVAKQITEDEVQICVKDSGVGIAEVHIDKIFEPFYRIDEARHRKNSGHSGGHGLGLAIAASAVRRHGGKIVARNRDSGGLEVTVTLPAKQAV